MDIGAIGSLMSTHTSGTIGGYADTPEGKVIAAAFTDSLTNLVDAVREYKARHVKGGQLKVAEQDPLKKRPENSRVSGRSTDALVRQFSRSFGDWR